MTPERDSSADLPHGRRCACAGSGAASLSRVALAELVGTALLVLLTCLPLCTEAARSSAVHRALSSGLVVAALVQCFDHISGAQFNPTVTLAAAIWGRWGRGRTAAMMASQLAGAALGAAALRLLRPQPQKALCVTLPASALGAGCAALVEAVLGGILALANCASWDVRVAHYKDSWPLRIGLTVAGMSLVAGDLTGASMNPVRSFGPALAAGVWTHHWVYWVGPLSGSALCTAAYCALWRPRTQPVRAHVAVHEPPLPPPPPAQHVTPAKNQRTV